MLIVSTKVMMMHEKKEYQQFEQDHQVNNPNLLQYNKVFQVEI